MLRRRLVTAALVGLSLLALPVAGASAAKNPTANAAMRKGARDFVRLYAEDGKLVSTAFACRPVPKVGAKGRCTGSFVVSLKGAVATYKLTSRARTLRISPGAIEYRLSARAATKIPGLPRSTDLLGFLQ